jgi:hypothetical protein
VEDEVEFVYEVLNPREDNEDTDIKKLKRALACKNKYSHFIFASKHIEVAVRGVNKKH